MDMRSYHKRQAVLLHLLAYPIPSRPLIGLPHCSASMASEKTSIPARRIRNQNQNPVSRSDREALSPSTSIRKHKTRPTVSEPVQPVFQDRYWSKAERQRFLRALFRFSTRNERERTVLIAKEVGTRNEKQVKAHRQKFYMRIIRDSKEDYFGHRLGERRERSVPRPNGSYHPRIECVHPVSETQLRMNSMVCNMCEKEGFLKNSSVPEDVGLFLLANVASIASRVSHQQSENSADTLRTALLLEDAAICETAGEKTVGNPSRDE
ncbi:Myb-like protein I [Gracilariopsis chorda]|uniref:Myb-like protein I n=1 Tax=Gracilariopsis chorda TaxID=448386 RepID=A0A2V3ILA6_9FLOR|nr:Myb-like protein I [Gracilariopsis chorda]|eukprot:PXF42865.1 Myb-like protein I [Gracilariopsis chorda]